MWLTRSCMHACHLKYPCLSQWHLLHILLCNALYLQLPELCQQPFFLVCRSPIWVLIIVFITATSSCSVVVNPIHSTGQKRVRVVEILRLFPFVTATLCTDACTWPVVNGPARIGYCHHLSSWWRMGPGVGVLVDLVGHVFIGIWDWLLQEQKKVSSWKSNLQIIIMGICMNNDYSPLFGEEKGG